MSRAAGARTSNIALTHSIPKTSLVTDGGSDVPGPAAKLLELREHQPIHLGDDPASDREIGTAQAEHHERRRRPRRPRRSSPPAPSRRSDRRRHRSSAQTTDSRRGRQTPVARPKPARHSPRADSSTAPAPACRRQKSDPGSARDRQRPASAAKHQRPARCPRAPAAADARVLVSMRYRIGAFNSFPLPSATVLNPPRAETGRVAATAPRRERRCGPQVSAIPG